MNIFEGIQSLVTEPTPPRKKRLGATTDSIALIANNGGIGVVLEFDGPGIEASIDDVSGRRLDDNGLDDAPDGLSIWEGHYCGSYDQYQGDYDAWLEGSFRPLTDAEWELLKTTGVPWKFEE